MRRERGGEYVQKGVRECRGASHTAAKRICHSGAPRMVFVLPMFILVSSAGAQLLKVLCNGLFECRFRSHPAHS
eukprot:12720-Eustigmatos_ZCMA.PRE.1